ncbi:MAG: homoserine kinase [Chloroflexi bacterium]|nr:homoserine kinase [Chloroflexota bacterium]MDA1239887.1 homoserine kinase [Chloroflexota bacterium]MQC25383.1 homoserine kinase [Chloroflexota bacterium]
MPDRSVTVRVPATSANLGPGFDSLGVALDWTGLITIRISDDRQPSPDGPMEHMAASAALALLEQAGERPAGIVATYEGDMPVGRGLGMSAAARAGGLVAANALLGDRLTMEELLALAIRLEGHGDNIIPALFGGVQVVMEDEGVPVHVKIVPPDDLRLALLVPEFSMPTEESRRLLPTSLTRNQAVHNIGRAAMVVAAITQGRYDVLRTAVEDILHQPARGTLFPAMFPIFEAARMAGAYGVYLSGGGSTIAAFVSPTNGEHVAGAMRERAAAHGVDSVTRVVAMSNTGTEVVSR